MSIDNFYYLDEPGIFFICAGKMYPSIKNCIGELSGNERHKYTGTMSGTILNLEIDLIRGINSIVPFIYPHILSLSRL